MKDASVIIKQAQKWLGLKEADGSHKQVLSVYNNHKPLARGYIVEEDDAWCATFVSAVAIAVGYTSIIPTECSCGKMISLLKVMGIWQENDAYVPQTGDIIFYDWQDTGVGDDTGWPDHVGYVEKVTGDVITVIEGNISNKVGRRNIKVNAKYIRGYGVPRYDTRGEVVTETPKVNVGDRVKVMLPVQYNGKPFKRYFDWYDVISVKGDRVTIGKGKVVTCAVKISNVQVI